MSGAEPSDDERRMEAILAAFERSGNGALPAELHLGQVLAELDAWLDDERQWRRGRPQHWKGLLNDLAHRLADVAALADGDVRSRLSQSADEVKALRGSFGGGESPLDEALRRRLRRASATAHELALSPELLSSAWRRFGDWADAGNERADPAVGTLRDLLALHGHDAVEVLGRVRDVLHDVAYVIAQETGEVESDAGVARAGLPAGERLALAETALRRPATWRDDGVVWLEYLQADLRFPWTLELGPSVTLYDAKFLRSMIHEAPEDERMPPELREQSRSTLTIWLDAYDREEASRADRTVPGDPRVFLRVEPGPMAEARLLAAARETADFLTGFASLYADNHAIWLSSESHFISGVVASSHAFSFDEDKARDELADDTTAMHLAEHAEALGRHLPLRDPKVRTAGRLLAWLRHATGTDDPAQLILSERVIEQVCGWAGLSEPSRFVAEILKPQWVYGRVRGEIDRAYRDLRRTRRGDHPLRDVIESPPAQRPHSPGTELPTVNLKRILEHVDELVDLAPVGSPAHARLVRLATRTEGARAASRWLDELGGEFDIRNARLRRTRNALMHGGPLVPGTVENVVRFAVALAHQSLGAALEMLLADDDLVEGFITRERRYRECFSSLRAGEPATEALFWSAA